MFRYAIEAAQFRLLSLPLAEEHAALPAGNGAGFTP